MKKKWLLFLPFFSGIIFIIYSWYISYPLIFSSANDLIFDRISIWYWISIPLLLSSMFMMSIIFENKYWKFAMVVGCLLVLYSLFFFYYRVPGSDSHYFRGLTEYFIKVDSLDLAQISHRYYQWPLFFILAEITTSISGFELANYEFILYTIIAFLFSSGLYVYSTTAKIYDRGSSIAAIVFFIAIYSFMNYQIVPFSLAFGIFFLLLMLETQKKSTNNVLIMLILFLGLLITHVFVPLFFVLYLLIRGIISRDKEYFRYFLLTTIIYFLIQITLGQKSFVGNIINILNFDSDYSIIVSSTLAPVSSSFDILAQMFSRIVIISFVTLCFIGFILLALRKRLRDVDKAIFLTGVIYLSLGAVLYTLGTRALPLAFVPVSLGILHLLKTRIRKYLICFILVLLILVVFIPIHSSFDDYPIEFQTKDELATVNHILEKYNWTSDSIIIADNGLKWYLYSQIPGFSEIDSVLSPRFELSNITNYDCIIYSIGLEKILQRNNISTNLISQQISIMHNRIYDSGLSYITKKSN